MSEIIVNNTLKRFCVLASLTCLLTFSGCGIIRFPNSISADLDSDGDGIFDLDELKIGTDPYDADTDDDGLSDGDEYYQRGLVHYAIEYFNMDISTSPTDPDSDNDGLPDGTELGVTEPILGLDGLLDQDENGDGTFIGDENGRKTYEYEVLISGDFFKDHPMDRVYEYRESYAFQVDENPASITSPIATDSNGNGIIDGDEDVNRNGRLDPGETDPLVGIHPIEDSVTTKHTDTLYVAIIPSEEAKLCYGGEWGDVISYYFDFGETDYDYVTIQLDNTDILLDKDVFIRTGNRVKFLARSNSVEASQGAGKIICYKDDQVVKEIPIRTWVGSPLRLTPYSRGDKWGPVPKSNLMDSTSDLDSDSDGILDHKEITLGTDPDDADTDDDGLSDGDEFYTRGKVLAASEYFGIGIKLDPRNPDTDFDGIPDGTEVGNTEPVLGIDGMKDTSIHEDGTFVGEGEQRLTFQYEHLETPNDLFDPNEMFLMRKANETSTRFRYLADMDPKTITNPVSNDTNGDDEFDGVQDSNGNGRFDDGESDPLIGLYVNDRWAPNKESRSILYVARLDDDVEMMANHPGVSVLPPPC